MAGSDKMGVKRGAPQRVSKLALHSIGHLRDEIRITPLRAALAFRFLQSENRVTVLFFMVEKEAKNRHLPHILWFVFMQQLFCKRCDWAFTM